MFRSRKKKTQAGSRRPVRAYEDENDENEQVQTQATTKTETGDNHDDEGDGDPPSALMVALQQRKNEKQKKKKGKRKSGGLLVRSFDPDGVEEEENDDDGHKKRRKKKRKRGGLGFGGVALEEEDGNGDTNTGESTAYGREALEQLKSEQERQTFPTSDTSEPLGTPANGTDSRNANGVSVVESFIPLDGDDSAEDTTRAASDSERLDKHESSSSMMFADANENNTEPSPEESHGWEQQIEKRAGIQASAPPAPSKKTYNLGSLEDLSKNMASTIATFEAQIEDIEHTTNRRRVDREHAMADSAKQQSVIQHTGKICEFYQETRRDLTLWLGALRELNEKVKPIEESFLEMLRTQAVECSREFVTWQDDCITALHEQKRLDRVLGRQPENSSLWNVKVVVDEFGRDVRSQHLRDRDQRFQKRMGNLQSQRVADSSKDAANNEFQNCSIIVCEDHDEAERSKALHQALEAALCDFDQDYTSAEGLKTIFDHWFATYYEDYQQCFATLSFGDLYAVLVQVEVHRSNFFPMLLLSSSENNTSSFESSSVVDMGKCFIETLKSHDADTIITGKCILNQNRTDAENHSRLARTVEKGFLPVLVDILKDAPFGIFYSSRKSFLLSRFIYNATTRHLQNADVNSELSILAQKLRNSIASAIQTALNGVAIPILKKKVTESEHTSNNSNSNESSLPLPSQAENCSVKYASRYQVEILRQVLCNIITYWFQFLSLDTENISNSSLQDDDGRSSQETGIRIVLNFINDKYLLLLSAIEHGGDIEQPLSAKANFQPLWEALQQDPRKIVEATSLMLLTMPLRAAAHAYQLN